MPWLLSRGLRRCRRPGRRGGPSSAITSAPAASSRARVRWPRARSTRPSVPAISARSTVTIGHAATLDRRAGRGPDTGVSNVAAVVRDRPSRPVRPRCPRPTRRRCCAATRSSPDTADRPAIRFGDDGLDPRGAGGRGGSLGQPLPRARSPARRGRATAPRRRAAGQHAGLPVRPGRRGLRRRHGGRPEPHAGGRAPGPRHRPHRHRPRGHRAGPHRRPGRHRPPATGGSSCRTGSRPSPFDRPAARTTSTPRWPRSATTTPASTTIRTPAGCSCSRPGHRARRRR